MVGRGSGAYSCGLVSKISKTTGKENEERVLYELKYPLVLFTKSLVEEGREALVTSVERASRAVATAVQGVDFIV